MSEDETGAELEFDMWEGQFEFVGQQYRDSNGNSELQGVGEGGGGGGYDRDADLFTPKRKNGFKKHHVQVWYEDLAGHVSIIPAHVA